MPVVTAANAFSFGIAKQTNEATVASVAEYTMPVFSADLGPRYDLRRIEVTDAASIEGDPYKGPTYWEGNIEVPALGASTGRILQAMYPTDTATPGTPNVHVFSGLGGTQSWVALYSDFTNASKPMTYGKGLCKGLTFTATSDGGPLRVGCDFLGEVPSQTAFTVTTADSIANGWFTLEATGATVEQSPNTADADPSGAITNVKDVTLTVARDVAPEPTVDSVTVANLAQGKVTTTGTMTFLYSSWSEYLATYFGSITGTAVSPTIVYGALDLNFKHSVQSTWAFKLLAKKVQFQVSPVTPDPSGAALTQTITLNFAQPASGDRLIPTLSNGVATAY